ncbi:HpcH/HpaI aldolase/citrate lyase family protein [Paenibacillus stellifer]|nr:HpcH/HpaI aldolase/citrate lyase family protein [Paenibacillus stellifer]
MRYFEYLTPDLEESLFYSRPMHFNRSTGKDLLAHAVGAALYMPATRPQAAESIWELKKNEGLIAAILDLEDAVGDLEAAEAEERAILHLARLAELAEREEDPGADLPLLFIRVRNPRQLRRLIRRLDSLILLLTGFVFPKFTVEDGGEYLEAVADYNRSRLAGTPPLYGMPILESKEILYRESRLGSLLSVRELLSAYREEVLNVRIGATDFSSAFGLRRSAGTSIYELAPIRDCISDIINLFGRAEDGYVISGPVWEYFASRGGPGLRFRPDEQPLGGLPPQGLAGALRPNRLNTLNGLIRETLLDKENGIVGKTVIHPSHLKPVQALYAVTHEEYIDAKGIMESTDGSLGVFKSMYHNKMNEIKPHLNWARRILIRSQIYGVLHEEQHFSGLLPEYAYAHV